MCGFYWKGKIILRVNILRYLNFYNLDVFIIQNSYPIFC